MKKFEYSDGEFILKEGPIEELLMPEIGHFVRTGGVNYKVEMIIQNHDEEKLMIVMHQVSK